MRKYTLSHSLLHTWARSLANSQVANNFINILADCLKFAPCSANLLSKLVFSIIEATIASNLKTLSHELCVILVVVLTEREVGNKCVQEHLSTGS